MIKFKQPKNFTPSPEDVLQAECWKWACNTYGVYRLLCHVPNQVGTRHPIEAQQLKAMGVTPGVHDLFFFWKNKLYWLECKVGSNSQSDDQKKFAAKMTEHGAICKEFRSVEQFQSIFKSIIES